MAACPAPSPLKKPEAVMDCLTRVQAEAAEATTPSDRDNIFAAIRAEKGFSRINAAIKEKLRMWLVERCVAHAAGLGANEELGPADAARNARFLRHTGDLVRELGFGRDAVSWYSLGKAMAARMAGAACAASDGDPEVLRDTLAILHGCALAMYGGKVTEGLAEAKAAFEHLSTLTSANAETRVALELELVHALVEAHQENAARGRLLALLDGEYLGAAQEQFADIGTVPPNAGCGASPTLAALAKTFWLQSEVETMRRKFYSARGYMEKALKATERLRGARSPAMGRLHCRAGRVLSMGGQFTLALEHLDSARAIIEEVLGMAHPELGVVLRERARVELHLKELPTALRLAHEAVKFQMQVLGLQHVDIAKSQLVVAAIHGRKGNYVAALPLLSTAESCFQTQLGRDHSLTRLCTQERKAVSEYLERLALVNPRAATRSGTICASFDVFCACIVTTLIQVG